MQTCPSPRLLRLKCRIDLSASLVCDNEDCPTLHFEYYDMTPVDAI